MPDSRPASPDHADLERQQLIERQSTKRFIAGFERGRVVRRLERGRDPFEPFVASAAAQTATAVLVTALLAPTVAAWVMRRAGAISAEKADMSDIQVAA